MPYTNINQLTLFSKEPGWESSDKEFLLWMAFAPALTVRERAVDKRSLGRAMSGIATLSEALEKNEKCFLKDLAPLYDVGLFDLRLTAL